MFSDALRDNKVSELKLNYCQSIKHRTRTAQGQFTLSQFRCRVIKLSICRETSPNHHKRHSGAQDNMPATIAGDVLAIPEILNLVLCYVAEPVDFTKNKYRTFRNSRRQDNLMTLWICRRVARQWRDVIDTFPDLQKLTWRKDDGRTSEPLLCYPAISYMANKMARIHEVRLDYNFRQLTKLLKTQKFPKIFIANPPVEYIVISFGTDLYYRASFEEWDEWSTKKNWRMISRCDTWTSRAKTEFLIRNPKGVTVADVAKYISMITNRFYRGVGQRVTCIYRIWDIKIGTIAELNKADGTFTVTKWAQIDPRERTWSWIDGSGDGTIRYREYLVDFHQKHFTSML